MWNNYVKYVCIEESITILQIIKFILDKATLQ